MDIGKEKVMPSPASMKLKYRKPKKMVSEGKETPGMEAKTHGPSFLRNAARLAGQK